MYKVANVKVSIKTTPLFLDTVYKNLLEKEFNCIQHNNFLVLKSEFTYIIFKTNKKGENHINITKIPLVEKIPEAIKLIQNLTNCFVISQTIDNIIATTNLNRKLNLVDISSRKKFTNIKYNNEKFPGLFVKFNIGTAIIFHSGKIVIVGSKSIENIECVLNLILVSI